MSATRATDAGRIGRYVAEHIDAGPDIVGIWTRQCDRTAELWILLDTEDVERERAVRRILWKLLERFPETEINLQVTNVHRVDDEWRFESIPDDARRVR